MVRGLLLGAFVSLAALTAQAEPTRVVVRAQSHDAKFIGGSMGGVRVALVDARSGRILAQGVTEGGTGDTKRLMTDPRERGKALTDDKTAGFEAVLDIARPTLVRAEAFGPLGKPTSAVAAASTRWVLPGQHIAGDGWILPFPGLVIEPQWTSAADGGLEVSAKITLMCGCPIEPGGMWNADNYRVRASLMDGDREVSGADLRHAGQPSTFKGALGAAPPGAYRLQITAVDSVSSNAGVLEAPLSLPEPRSRGGR